MRQKPSINASIEITKMSLCGEGEGTYTSSNGQEWPVIVPYTMPGDRVNVDLLKRRKGQYNSRIQQLLTPSSQRAEPLCSHFTSCGGCRLQHLSYETELQQKEQLVKQLFLPYLSEETRFHSIIGSETSWHYRNKMEFTFSESASGHKNLGLYQANSRGRVVDLQECLISPYWFEKTLRLVKEWWHETSLTAYYPPRNSGDLRTLTLREGKRSQDRMIILTVSAKTDLVVKSKELNLLVQTLSKGLETHGISSSLSIYLRKHVAIKGQPTTFEEILLKGPKRFCDYLHLEKPIPQTLLFQVAPSAFFQPNAAQAELIYSRALELAELTQQETLFDLYCGTGTLSMFAAKLTRQVIGIELNEEAIASAKTNLQLNSIHNVTFFQGDVGNVLNALQENNQLPKADLVLVDPPRSGLLDNAIAHILSINASKILYISCNPMTQADDIKHFIQAGYRIRDIQPVDQCPHTPHIENIVVLT